MLIVDESAFALDPHARGIHWQKAHALMEGARWEEAFDTLDAAEKEDSTNKYVFGFRALLQHKIGRPAAALSQFQKHLDLAPTD